MRRITLVVLLVVVAVSMLGLQPRPAAAASYVRWAYYVPNDPRSYRSLQAAHGYLDIVSPDAWRLQPDGSITSRVQPAVVAQMRAWGLKVVPMVAKWSWNDKMHGFFASSAARNRAAARLADLVVSGDYDGIHIDIENIEPRDALALEAWVADISARMRANGRLMTMALPARTVKGGSAPHFNYARLGKQLDLAVIMAYDYSYAGGPPGPVAPIGWGREVAAYAAGQIPRSKVLLGVPWYGYDWNLSTRRAATYVSYGEAAAKPGKHGYDGRVHAAAVRYSVNGQQHELWYENAQSTKAKFEVVVGQGLGGWAAWRLGYEDPAVWGLIAPRRGG